MTREQREPWRLPTRERPASKWDWARFALPSAVVWSFYLLVFWPGVLTVDSIDQWTQIVTGDYSDWHPAFHSLTQWLLTRIVNTPGLVAATQVAVAAAVVGWALASMRRIGLSSRIAWTVAWVVALWPTNGITLITLWKDVPYSIGVLALSVILLLEVDGRQSVLSKRYGWAPVGLTAGLVVLYHHVGVVIAAGFLLALIVVSKKRAAMVSALTAVVLVTVAQGGLYRVAGVEGVEHPGIDSKIIQHIGAHLDGGTSLTQEERLQATQLIPDPDLSWYDCQTIVPMIIDERFSVERMHERASEARALWLKLLRRNPAADLEQLVCTGSFVWRVRLLPDAYRYATGLSIDADGEVSTVAENEYGLARESALPVLTKPLGRLISSSQDPATAWLWWRGAIYLYVLLAGAAIASLRARNWRYWAVVVPSGLVAGVLALVAPAHDFRFMYPVVLTGMVIGPHLLLAVRRVRLHAGSQPP